MALKNILSNFNNFLSNIASHVSTLSKDKVKKIASRLSSFANTLKRETRPAPPVVEEPPNENVEQFVNRVVHHQRYAGRNRYHISFKLIFTTGGDNHECSWNFGESHVVRGSINPAIISMINDWIANNAYDLPIPVRIERLNVTRAHNNRLADVPMRGTPLQYKLFGQENNNQINSRPGECVLDYIMHEVSFLKSDVLLLGAKFIAQKANIG